MSVPSVPRGPSQPGDLGYKGPHPLDRHPLPSTELPGDGQYAVTIEVDCAMSFDWHGHATNTTDALYKTLEAWDAEYRRRREVSTRPRTQKTPD